MKIPSFLLAFLPLASGFHIPANTRDGVYKAYYDNNGKEVHVLLTPEMLANDTASVIAANLAALPSTLTLPARRRAFNKQRDLPPKSQFNAGHNYPPRGDRRDMYKGTTITRRSYCECNHNLDHSDADAATERLRDQIKRAGGTVYVPINQGIYGTVNGVTAFICTPERNSAVTPVNVADYDYALRFITEHCGRYIPGMYIHGDLNGEQMDQHASAEDLGYTNNKYGDVWVLAPSENSLGHTL
ncbi:hypothetical protein BR93DRAFT_961829 [Coniochaeta sp. PMI_546]|nr:hypothetical protein BR93DRAFT_961829 [Coniochaeta sp. PMI_546]